MRQILIGAWLVLASSAIGCSGKEFAAGRDNGDLSSTGSSSSESQAGSQADPGSAGATSASGGSGNTSGGKASSAGSGGDTPPGASGSTSSGGGGKLDESPDCVDGEVTFKMVPAPDLAADYLCDASCGTGWLTITEANGARALSIFPACAAVTCESCEALPCAAAVCLPTPLTAEGTELSWRGLSLVADSCGAGTACQRQSCVKPGKYKARACAHVNAGQNSMSGACMPKDAVMLCSEAEFEFPGTSEVVLVLQQQ